jgi:hypothetical protein
MSGESLPGGQRWRRKGIHGWQKESFFLEAEISKPTQIEWMLAIPGQPNKHWVTNGSVCYFVGSLL